MKFKTIPEYESGSNTDWLGVTDLRCIVARELGG